MDILTDKPELTANEYVQAKTVADNLHRHYPGHLWAVNVSGSVINIFNLNLSGRNGYTLHIPGQFSASDFDRQVVRAGGEILERYHQARTKLNEDRLAEAPMDFAGNLLFET